MGLKKTNNCKESSGQFNHRKSPSDYRSDVEIIPSSKHTGGCKSLQGYSRCNLLCHEGNSTLYSKGHTIKIGVWKRSYFEYQV